jgi:hypothetical protein
MISVNSEKEVLNFIYHAEDEERKFTLKLGKNLFSSDIFKELKICQEVPCFNINLISEEEGMMRTFDYFPLKIIEQQENVIDQKTYIIKKPSIINLKPILNFRIIPLNSNYSLPKHFFNFEKCKNLEELEIPVSGKDLHLLYSQKEEVCESIQKIRDEQNTQEAILEIRDEDLALDKKSLSSTSSLPLLMSPVKNILSSSGQMKNQIENEELKLSLSLNNQINEEETNVKQNQNEKETEKEKENRSNISGKSETKVQELLKSSLIILPKKNPKIISDDEEDQNIIISNKLKENLIPKPNFSTESKGLKDIKNRTTRSSFKKDDESTVNMELASQQALETIELLQKKKRKSTKNIQTLENSIIPNTSSFPQINSNLPFLALPPREKSASAKSIEKSLFSAESSSKKFNNNYKLKPINEGQKRRSTKSIQIVDSAKTAISTVPALPMPLPCSICLEPITNKSQLDSCEHEFCKECIDQWAVLSNQCPLCKEDFKKITYWNEFKGQSLKTEKKVRRRRFKYEEEEAEPWYENCAEFCMVCSKNNDEHLLLVCDKCMYNICHTYCAGLDMIPDEEWICSNCSNPQRSNQENTTLTRRRSRRDGMEISNSYNNKNSNEVNISLNRKRSSFNPKDEDTKNINIKYKLKKNELTPNNLKFNFNVNVEFEQDKAGKAFNKVNIKNRTRRRKIHKRNIPNHNLNTRTSLLNSNYPPSQNASSNGVKTLLRKKRGRKKIEKKYSLRKKK